MSLLKKLAQLMLSPFPSVIKVPMYRLMGARIAHGAGIAPLVVFVADEIDMGPHAKIKPLSIIYSPCRLTMGAYSVIGNLSVIHGPSAFSLGPRSYVSAGGMIDLYRDVSIGEFTALGPRCTLMTHGVFWPSTWGLARKIGGITIGDLSWAANNCTITADVKIGSRVLVMAGSVVSRDILEPSMVIDVPRNRTVLPYHRVQKSVSARFLREHVAEVTRACYDEVLRLRSWTLDDSDSLLTLRKGRRVIRIALVGSSPAGAKADWLFGFGLDDDLLSGSRGVVALDFLRLLHTPKPDRVLKVWLEYFRHMWGIRFADFRYRMLFSVAPPKLEPEDEHRADDSPGG